MGRPPKEDSQAERLVVMIHTLASRASTVSGESMSLQSPAGRYTAISSAFRRNSVR